MIVSTASLIFGATSWTFFRVFWISLRVVFVLVEVLVVAAADVLVLVDVLVDAEVLVLVVVEVLVDVLVLVLAVVLVLVALLLVKDEIAFATGWATLRTLSTMGAAFGKICLTILPTVEMMPMMAPISHPVSVMETINMRQIKVIPLTMRFRLISSLRN